MQEPQDKLWNAEYLKVMLTNFTLSFAFYLLAPLLPLYLSQEFGAGKDTIGLVLSGYAITALLIRPFSGFLADSFPRKKVLLVSLFLYFMCFGLYLLAGSLLMFAIVRTLHGGPFGASTVANSTMAIDVLPSSRRTEGIGFYGISNNIATAIAPSIGLWVYQATGNFEILFWIAFVVAGIGFCADATVKVKERQLIKNKKALSWDRFFLLKGWSIGVNIALFGLCYGVLSNFLAIYSQEEMGISGGTGVFFLLLAIGLILARVTGVKSLRAGRLLPNALQGIIFSTFGYVLFVASPNEVGYYGAPLLIGWGNGHFWPAFQNMIINVARKDERGTANSTLLTSWDLGLGIGIVMGGFLAENISYSFAFWSVAAVHLVGFAFFFRTRRNYLRANIENQ